MTSILLLSISFFRFSSLNALFGVLTFYVPNLRGPISVLSLLFDDSLSYNIFRYFQYFSSYHKKCRSILSHNFIIDAGIAEL
uniref:Putative secreted protein n=1 Tax=Xenopsylla cheopis TaxID=163159 RepID=A0A6M2DZ51_XENCH